MIPSRHRPVRRHHEEERAVAVMSLRTLGGERFQSLNNGPHFNDQTLDLSHRYPATLGVAERYLNGNVLMHVHVDLQVGGHIANAEQFCITYRKASAGRDAELADLRDLNVLHRRDLYPSRIERRRQDPRCMDTVVLVYVAQPLELRKGLILRAVPSVVRLHLFDQRHGIWMDASDTLGEVAGDGLGEDRKCVTAIWRAIVGEHELNDEILQRRAQVVYQVPDDDSPLVRRIWEWLPPEDVPSGLGIVLLDDAYRMRFGPAFDPAIKVSQVFIGADDSQPCIV